MLSPVLVLAFSRHLCAGDAVQRNHRMCLGPRPQTNLSVNFDIATVVRAATNADTTGFLSNFRVSDRLSSGKHVARFRGWSVRETQGTDVTKAGCPASQHTQ